MADIFISYARAHHETTRTLARDLEAAGYTVWWDTSLLTGDVYRTTLDEQIEAAKAVIIIWTPESINSLWVVAEAEHALRLGKLFNTLHGVQPEKVPKPFNQVHGVDVTDRAAILTALSVNGVSPSGKRSATPQWDSTRPDRSTARGNGGRRWIIASVAAMAAAGAVAITLNPANIQEIFPDLAARLAAGLGGTAGTTTEGAAPASSVRPAGTVPQALPVSIDPASERLRAELRDREAALEEAKKKADEAERRNKKLLAERAGEEARQAEIIRRQMKEQQERLESAKRLADEAERRSAQIKAENLAEEQRRREQTRQQRLDEQARIEAINRAAEENQLRQQKIEAEAKFNATLLELQEAQRKAAAAVAAPTTSGNKCEQLWMARNSIFAQHGYCFETPKAVSVFGRGCRPPFGKLTSTAKARVDNIQVQELQLGCR